MAKINPNASREVSPSDTFETYLATFQSDLDNGIQPKNLRSYVSVMAFSGIQTRDQKQAIVNALDLALSRHNNTKDQS